MEVNITLIKLLNNGGFNNVLLNSKGLFINLNEIM